MKIDNTSIRIRIIQVNLESMKVQLGRHEDPEIISSLKNKIQKEEQGLQEMKIKFPEYFI